MKKDIRGRLESLFWHIVTVTFGAIVGAVGANRGWGSEWYREHEAALALYALVVLGAGLAIGTFVWMLPDILRDRRERRIRKLCPGGLFLWATEKGAIKFVLPRGESVDPVGKRVLTVPRCKTCGQKPVRWQNAMEAACYRCNSCDVSILPHLHPDQIVEAANEAYRQMVLTKAGG